jgi:type II secretory pathway component HofQ
MPRRASLLAAAALFAGAPTGAAPPAESPRVVVVSPALRPASPARSPGSDPAARSIPVISLSVKDADLVEVVRSLARIAGVNLIIDPGVQGKVTAELVGVRWDHALAVILKTQGLGMELDGRILTVAEPRRLPGAR